MHDKTSRITFLIFKLASQILMPAHRANPGFFRTYHGDRLAFDQNISRVKINLRRIGKYRSARIRFDERCFHLLDLVGNHRPLCGLTCQQIAQFGLFGRQLVTLGPQGHFFQPPQRSQTHIKHRIGLIFGQAKLRHQFIAGVICLTNNGNHFIQIQINNQIAFEHLKPRGNSAQTVFCTPLQHHAAMRQPCIQRAAQIHNPGPAIRI